MARHEQENQYDDDASAPRSWLPDDVVMEILACLPAKSVGRFRCVSRSWDATLSSAAFVELHLRRANYQSAAGRPKIFFSPTDEPSDDYFFYAWQPGGAVTKLMDNDFLRPAPLTRPLHGLVLLRCVRSGGYYVCNPSTGAVLPLPDTRVPWKMTFQSSLPYYRDVVYGLGYCSASHQYKAVRIFSNENSMDAPCCDVFVLGSDTPAYWRPATSEHPMCVVKEENPAVFLNGHLHFLCRYDGGILTFNVMDETFGSMPLPPYPLGKDPLGLRTTELDGCLCVFDAGSGDGDGLCHVWLLRDYEAQRWEQLCCIDRAAWPEPERTQLESSWIAPLGLSNASNGSDKKIMFGTGTCMVFTVDQNGGGVPEILFRPDEAIAGSFIDTYDFPYDFPALGLFEESLVPVGRDIEEMIFSSPVTEAWYDVLKWLPAQSVSKLSLVCREWRAMITTDCFIRSHAAVHATRPRIKFAIDPLVVSFSDLDDHINNRLFYGNGMPYDNPVQFSQPCHGLNLGRWSFGDYLYNPTLGISQRIEDVERDAVFFGRSIALGFDSEVEDHVMVSLAYEQKNMGTREYKLRCDVRSLQRGNFWCSYDPPPRPVAVNVPPAYVNGKIYWVVEHLLAPESEVCELLVFDVIDSEFEVMQGPSWSSHGSGRTSILELYGAISMAWWDDDRNAIDVWRMKDMDGAWYVECRVELDKFSPQYSSREITLMCADPIGGQILLNTGRSLGYYNPETATLETIYTSCW
ncbi:hypothetical protein VPH35_007095 [Triticum aestivum]|uniref:uncharacterized protein n=1 Tax=Triticum aestivum TaxID=4565 RepID=UPI0008459879|nr:uncharacterized protein LOC123087675 [Triticum aestivum]